MFCPKCGTETPDDSQFCRKCSCSLSGSALVMPTVATAPSEIESLRDELRTLRNEIADARVERAARHLELMRNWMSWYTPTVSVAFLIFAIMGYRGLSDLEAGKERVEAKAVEVEKAAGDLNSSIEAVKTKQQEFIGLVSENRDVVSKNKLILNGFQSSLDRLEAKNNALKASADKVEEQLTTLSSKVSSTSTLLSNSSALTNGLGSLLSASLNVPIILTGPTVDIRGDDSLGGNGFGSEPGKLFIHAAATKPPGVIALPSSDLAIEGLELPGVGIKSWSDDRIIFSDSILTSLIAPLIGGAKPGGYGLEFQIQTKGGTKSNIYRVSPPASPLGLGVTLQ